MAKKKEVLVMVREHINYVSGTFDKFVDSLRKEFEMYVPEEFRATAHLSIETREEQYSDDKYGTVEVTWYRPENEKEKKVRTDREENYEKSRRQQYEDLKKEFGG